MELWFSRDLQGYSLWADEPDWLPELQMFISQRPILTKMKYKSGLKLHECLKYRIKDGEKIRLIKY